MGKKKESRLKQQLSFTSFSYEKITQGGNPWYFYYRVEVGENEELKGKNEECGC